MTAIPKPTKSKKKGNSAPQITEDEIMEISERLSDAYEFGSEITITTYHRKKYEKYTGVIKNVNTDTKMITFDNGGLDHLKISANIIVGVE